MHTDVTFVLRRSGQELPGLCDALQRLTGNPHLWEISAAALEKLRGREPVKTLRIQVKATEIDLVKRLVIWQLGHCFGCFEQPTVAGDLWDMTEPK
jgi:hypothetical protein